MTPWLLALLLITAGPPQQRDLSERSRAASDAMQKGRFEEAAAIYEQMVRAVPKEPGLLMNLGMALAMGGREVQAIGPLERAVSLNPNLVPAQLFLGTSYLAVGQPQKAVAPLRRAVAAQPRNVEYRRLLARAHAESGRPVDAAGELRRITELAPASPAAWHALFHAYNAVAQDAIASFADDGVHGPWQDLLLADALLSDGRYTDAFATYQQARAALPAMVTIHDSIAAIYEKTGHMEWAARERARGVLPPAACAKRRAACEFRARRYRAALAAALAGKDVESRYWVARAAAELADEAFRRLDKLPDSRERRETRAALAMADRKYPEAVTEFRAALKFAPDDPPLRAQLGVALHLSREYDEAVRVLSPLVEAQALEDVRVLTAYGDALLQLDRVEEAVPILRRAFTADTSDGPAALALARAYLRQKEFAAALPLLEWQLPGDVDGSVHVQLSRALAGLGQQQRAEATLAKAEELQRAAQAREAEAGRRTITPPEGPDARP